MRGILQLCPAVGFFTAYNGGSGNNGGSGSGTGAGATPAWEGNTTFTNWAKSSGDEINITKEKITSQTIGLKITWSASVNSDVVIQILEMNSWTKVKFRKSDDNPGYTDTSYGWQDSTSIDYTFDPNDLASIRDYGVQIQGNNITFTKVEIIE